MQLTTLQMDAILDALIATGGPWDPAAVWTGIATDVVDHGIDTVLADLTIPALADYPRKPITAWSTPYTLSDGRRAVDGPLHHFVGTGTGTPPNVTHWYLVNSATVGDLLGFDFVLPNKTLATVADALDMIVRLTVDPSGKWDATVIIPT